MSKPPKSSSDNANPERGNLSATIRVTIVLAAIGVVAFIILTFTLTPSFFPDVFKLTYQFLLLVVFGGAVSWLFTEYSKKREEKQKAKERQQEKRAEDKALVRKLYSDLIQAYNSAKRVKRLLRATAQCLSPNQNDDAIMIAIEPYHKQMQALIDIQLQFETFKEEVEINPALSSENAELETLQETLKRNLDSIEDYLNDIVDEYEKIYTMHLNTTPTLPLSKLPKLGEFIGKHSGESDIKTKFRRPAYQVMKVLLNLLTSE